MYICVTHLTPVIQCTDVMCILIRQLLAIVASEAQCVFVAEGGGMQPGSRVEAVVGEGLLGCSAQQLQKGQLDHMDWNTICPGVGKLEENTKITQVTYMKDTEIFITKQVALQSYKANKKRYIGSKLFTSTHHHGQALKTITFQMKIWGILVTMPIGL